MKDKKKQKVQCPVCREFRFITSKSVQRIKTGKRTGLCHSCVAKKGEYWKHLFMGKGKNHPMYGRKHMKESREKMSKTGKLRWEDKEYRERMVKLAKERTKGKGESHPMWKGGISRRKNKCKCGKVLFNYRAKQCKDCYWKSMKGVYTDSMRRGSLLGAKTLSNKKPTSIEVKVYRELQERGLLFETQKIINGKFIVDAYIPKLNLIIEIDGDYWHSLERIKNKDKAENAYLTKCGYGLLRLSGTEVKSGEFINRLEEGGVN